jgi:phage shock protein A
VVEALRLVGLDDQEDRVVQVTADLHALQGEINELRRTVEELRERVRVAESQTAAFSAECSRLRSRLRAAKGE